MKKLGAVLLLLAFLPGCKLSIRTVADALSLSSSFTCSTDSATGFAGGTGVLGDPYQICSRAQLEAIDNFQSRSTAYFKQTDDIDMGGASNLFTGLHFGSTGFNGEYDGNGKTISNMVISEPDYWEVGLFGKLNSAAVVKNLTITDSKTFAYGYAGILTGNNLGTIQGVSIKNSVVVATDGYAGLLTGYNSGNISTSSADGKASGDYLIGLVAGYSDTGTIEKTSAFGKVAVGSQGGGFVGNLSSGTISESFAIATVTSILSNNSGSGETGGFVGYYQDGIIQDSYFAGKVVGQYTGASPIGAFTSEISGGGTWDNLYAITSAVSDTFDGTDGNFIYQDLGGSVTISDSFYLTHANAGGNTGYGTGVASATALLAQIGAGLPSSKWKAPTSGYSYPILSWQSATDPLDGHTVDITSHTPLKISTTEDLSSDLLFGSITDVGTSSSKTLTIQNNSANTIHIDTASTFLNEDFTVDSVASTCLTTNATLAPAATCGMTVKFTPIFHSQMGMWKRADGLMISFTETVGLNTYPHEDLYFLSGEASATSIIGINTSTYQSLKNFVNDTNTIPFTIFNYSTTENLTLTDIQFSNADFSALTDGTCKIGDTLTPGPSCDLNISFSPTVVDDQNLVITLTFEDALANEYVTHYQMSVQAIVNPFDGGHGTLADPFLVANLTQLQEVDNWASGTYYFKQTANIDAASVANWTPIRTFLGHYDGDHHTISNLTMSRTTQYAGLFSIISVGASVQDLTLSNTTVTTTALYAGSLAGKVDIATVTGITSSGTCTVTGVGTTGGLIGYISNASDVHHLVSYCNVNATGTGGSIGGLVGDIRSGITDSYAYGDVVSAGAARFIGGFAGVYFNGGGWFKDCGAEGNVSGVEKADQAMEMGGFVGAIYSGGQINSSYATGNVTVTSCPQNVCYGVGGFVGSLRYGGVVEVIATGNVTSLGVWVGGLVGYNQTTIFMSGIIHSFATGTVSGKRKVGGLLGFTAPNTYIINSYSLAPSITCSGCPDSAYAIAGNNATDNYFGVGTGTVTFMNTYYLNTGSATANAGTNAIAPGTQTLQTSYPLLDFTIGPSWKMPTANPVTGVLSPVSINMCGKFGITCP